MMPTEVMTDDRTHAVPAAGVGARARLLAWPGWPMVLILAVGILVRALLWADYANAPIHIWDEGEYNALALNLANGGEYTYELGGTPTSLRPPLFPALMAVVYERAGPGNFAAVRLVQAALSLWTVIVVYRLGREIASRRAATWAAGLCCFYPSLLIYNNLLLTEVLFTLLLTTGCYFLVLAQKRSAVKWAALAGLALGLATLTRSVLWLAPPFVAAFLLLTWRGGWGRRLAAAVAFVAVFAVTIAPWAIRNTRLQETFIAIDTMGGRNFMMGNYRYTPLYRSWDAISLTGEQAWWHEVFSTYPPELRRTQGQVDKLALALGLKYVRAHPGLTAERDLVKFFDFWGLERELVAGAGQGFFGHFPRPALLALTAIIMGFYVAVLFLAIFGAMCAAPADRRAHWLFVCVIAFVCGLHTIVFGHSRYHLPLVPLLLIYAACALTQLGPIWRQRRNWSFRLATGACVVLLAGWAWSFIAVDWGKFVAAWKAAA